MGHGGLDKRGRFPFVLFFLLLFYSIIFPVCTLVVKAGGGTSTGNIYSSTVLLKKNLTKGPCLCDPHSAESARPPLPPFTIPKKTVIDTKNVDYQKGRSERMHDTSSDFFFFSCSSSSSHPPPSLKCKQIELLLQTITDGGEVTREK